MPAQVRRDPESAEFFDAAAEGRLLIRHCPGCHRCHAPRHRECPRCGGELAWRPATGEATLVTWSITPAVGDDPALAFGYVELAEGPWLETLLVDVPVDRLAEGLPLRVTFLRRDEEAIPAFGLPG